MSTTFTGRAERVHTPEKSDRAATPSQDQDFESRVRPHLDSMLRIARALLHSEDLAQDAVQQVLLRAWQRESLPDDPGPLLRALTQLTSRHVRRTLRRRVRHEDVGGRLRATEVQPSPVLSCQQHETCRVIQQALAELAPDHREVLVLHELDGLAYRDVALRIGAPIGTVRSRIARARGRLREVLVRKLGEEPDLES